VALTSAIDFRPLAADDLRLVHDWLGRDHVRRWWGDPGTYADVVDHYLPAIEGRDPTDLYAITADETPVGLIQTYLVVDYPQHAALVDVDEQTAGLDLFIGEAALVGRGLGSEVIRLFVDGVVFARAATRSCVADPDVRNTASIRSFENAGFLRVRDFHDPNDGRLHVLVCKER
jgi:RimJ/RimL family protein N-acetyltransferase